MKDVELNNVNIEILKEVDFAKGLIPTIIQDFKSGEVLMLAYMNEEALKKTIETGTTWFWSRSRQEFWNKGATSGHLQYVKNISVDCDGDTLLIKVDQIGAACHTGSRSCFYRNII
ncbi:MAG: phosphoribosyl-AMP cyclohydrolase [Clostridiaceae bacterium]|nr:phosphoribosyl-AMP cyclohydrolase [Clostridiaceae bacterium]